MLTRKWISYAMPVALSVLLLAGCSQPGGSSKGTSDTYQIDVIVKATDSDFWQTVLMGAEKAAADSNGKIAVKTYGPPSEKDIDQQISILENVISKKPDGIVIASTSSDASVPGIENAMKQNIPVVLVDNRINTDQFTSFLATDNVKGGALAADMFVKALEEQGKELAGNIGIISSMAGVQVLIDRNTGFLERLKEIAPNVVPLETRYVDADITKALGAAEDILTKNPDVLGFFADNNSTGVGVARAITERNLEGKVPVVAYDADNEEINALKSGAIYALIVQDPFGMGYKGVENVVQAIEGKDVQKEVDTGATAVTMENFETDEIQELLYPDKRD
ncbi:LacI family transcriptional regulator [Paenibacillaceae bacterium]|nr:LacI family transcriptional regulator [Paenibacillaceae bacterium]